MTAATFPDHGSGLEVLVRSFRMTGNTAVMINVFQLSSSKLWLIFTFKAFELQGHIPLVIRLVAGLAVKALLFQRLGMRVV